MKVLLGNRTKISGFYCTRPNHPGSRVLLRPCPNSGTSNFLSTLSLNEAGPATVSLLICLQRRHGCTCNCATRHFTFNHVFLHSTVLGVSSPSTCRSAVHDLLRIYVPAVRGDERRMGEVCGASRLAAMGKSIAVALPKWSRPGRASVNSTFSPSRGLVEAPRRQSVCQGEEWTIER